MNWHGKALGGKTDAVISAVEALIKNPGAAPSNILPPVMDAPVVDISGVAMSAPPSYELGQKLATRQGDIYIKEKAKLTMTNRHLFNIQERFPVSCCQSSCLSLSKQNKYQLMHKTIRRQLYIIVGRIALLPPLYLSL